MGILRGLIRLRLVVLSSSVGMFKWEFVVVFFFLSQVSMGCLTVPPPTISTPLSVSLYPTGSLLFPLVNTGFLDFFYAAWIALFSLYIQVILLNLLERVW